MHSYRIRGENVDYRWIVKLRIGEAWLRGDSWRPGPMVGRAQCLVNINTNLVLPSGKPRCMSYYFKLWHLYTFLLLVHYISGVDWNPNCMIPRIPWVILVCTGRWSAMLNGFPVEDEWSLALARNRMIRSRVISGYSRDTRYINISGYELLNWICKEWRIETGREMMRIHTNGSRTGFLGVLVPSVSVEDRPLSGPADHVWIVLTAYRE